MAEDLIHTHRFTSARHLAIRGGSNGGLLMGNMFVQRPDLFQAVCCAVPLLDMKAYTKYVHLESYVVVFIRSTQTNTVTIVSVITFTLITIIFNRFVDCCTSIASQTAGGCELECRVR